MEKYDNIVKSAEIRKLVDTKMYEKALMILDTMDLTKIKVLTDLSVYAEVYTHMGRYQDAMKILLRIRDKSNSRRIIYQLIRLSIRVNDIESAEEYYDDYIDAAPRDSERFVLRYRIDKMKGEDLSVLIETLEKLKEYDYIEKWAYELAKLYHKAGFKDKCVRECSDIVLWFGEGIIVEKAKLLKEHYVGSPKHINAFRADERRAIIEKNGLTKTKDLAQVSNEIKSILDEEMSAYLFEEEQVKQPEQSEEEQVEQLEQSEKEQVEQLEQSEEEQVKQPEQIIEVENVIESIEETTKIKELELEELAEGLRNNKEIQRIFKNYLKIPELGNPICRSLQKLQMGEKSRLFLVMGDSQSGKTTISSMIAGALFKMGLIKTGQIAKINANKLNRINLLERQERLRHGAVIIEEAGMLEPNAIQQMLLLLQQLGESIVFFLEDETENIERLLKKNLELKQKENFYIQIPIYEKDDLRLIALDYLENQEYGIEKEGIEALDKRIEEIIQVERADHRFSSMIECLKRVKEKADHRHMASLLDVVNTGDYEHSGLDRVKACDFQLD